MPSSTRARRIRIVIDIIPATPGDELRLESGSGRQGLPQSQRHTLHILIAKTREEGQRKRSATYRLRDRKRPSRRRRRIGRLTVNRREVPPASNAALMEHTENSVSSLLTEFTRQPHYDKQTS